MLTLAALKEYGANVEEGLARCANHESLYLRLVKTMPGNAGFPALYEAVGKKDYPSAFQAAHGLKGAAGNLSLTPLMKPIYEITELLRASKETDYSPLLEAIEAQRKKLEAICQD